MSGDRVPVKGEVKLRRRRGVARRRTRDAGAATGRASQQQPAPQVPYPSSNDPAAGVRHAARPPRASSGQRSGAGIPALTKVDADDCAQLLLGPLLLSGPGAEGAERQGCSRGPGE